VLPARAELAEGPVWDAARGVLWWVDIRAGHVHAFDPRAHADRTFDIGTPVGSLALRTDGTLLLAAQDAFLGLAPETGAVGALLNWPPETHPRMSNDGKCDSVGRFVVGRLSRAGQPREGALYRLDADWTLNELLTGLTVPNGLAWSHDGSTLYFNDSASHEVRAYAYGREGDLAAPGERLLAWNGAGEPDGMTIDEDGCLWVADWGGGQVRRISPTGEILATVTVPASQVSSCTFGGAHFDELFITTAREGFGPDDDAREPLAGSVFRSRPRVRGLPAVPFAA
jgi:sugar lactone lactonase YvrE